MYICFCVLVMKGMDSNVNSHQGLVNDISLLLNSD